MEMKRRKQAGCFLLFLVFLMTSTALPVPGVASSEGTILSLSASYSAGRVSVNGTTTPDILAVAVLLYDTDGSTLLRMETFGVAEQVFSATIAITLSPGTYTVRVANYAGGSFTSTTFSYVKSGGSPGGDVGNPADNGSGEAVEPAVVAKPTETETGQTVHEVRVTTGLIPDIVSAKLRGETSLKIDVTAALPRDAEIEVLAVQIPKDIVKSLAGLEVVLNTPYGDLTLPQTLVEALATAGKEIALTIQPGAPAAVEALLIEGDKPLTEPIEITTELTGNITVTLPCNLPLPADAEERKTFLASLYVLAIHGADDVDHLAELVFNIEEETGILLTVSFQVDHFSTFALVAAGAEPEVPALRLYTPIDGRTYVINDDIKAFDNVTSYRANGTTTVIAVRLLQELGAQIGYRRVDNVGIITVIFDDTTATLREGSNVMTVVDRTGERQIILRTVFTNFGGRTYLPTRDVAENLGFFIHWLAEDDSITITVK